MNQSTLNDEFTPLDTNGLQVMIDGEGDLQVTLSDGSVHRGVKLVRAFPFSCKDKFISLRSQGGKEIGMLEDLSTLDGRSRQVILDELEKEYFIPKITRVHKVEVKMMTPVWQVDTDKGPRTFEVGSRRDARFVGPNHIIIKGIDGIRYEIPDLLKLDEVSKAYVEREV